MAYTILNSQIAFKEILCFVLRGVFGLSRQLPIRLASFLNYAGTLHLLLKVAGGYMFIHRYLFEHAAAMEEDGAEKSTTTVSAERPV